MPNPVKGPGATPFDEEAPEQSHVTDDGGEEVPGHPPVREGSPLVDPDRAPGVPEPMAPGPGSPS
jgi:hypothetical protein